MTPFRSREPLGTRLIVLAVVVGLVGIIGLTMHLAWHGQEICQVGKLVQPCGTWPVKGSPGWSKIHLGRMP